MVPERVHAAILGAGFGGLAMAISLRRAGLGPIAVLERGDAIGGTWRDNHYPGCACDVPAHLYSYSFAPKADWSEAYAPQAEIRAYIDRVAAAHHLAEITHLGAEVESAELNERAATWHVRCRDGRAFVADILVVATGGLSRPAIPALPGLERFAGPTWHSATWRHDLPLSGKRVAVVGTGASAVQFVPRIAPKVARLHLFQRTPPWILPRPDHRYGPLEQRLLALAPLRLAYRQLLYWRHELRAIPFTLEPRLLKLAQRQALRHLRRQIADPALRRALTPDYVMGCKRILLSNDYYPALARDNVELVTAGIREITATGVVTADGCERPVDALIFGTGFQVHDYLGPLRIVGRGGAELGARWRDNPEAYLGTTVPGFPNLFCLVGPNTGLGHNSILLMIEAQVRHILSCLRAMQRAGAALIEPRAEVSARYNRRLQARLARTVWMTGCQSWYQNDAGKNTTLWPGTTAEFALRTWRLRRADYRMQPRGGGAS